jgi:hypothetical protein
MNIVADAGLRANDVLLGRGSGPSQYEGNKRFRAVVWETFQNVLHEEQARHNRRGDKLSVDTSFPTTLGTYAKARLCRIVRDKIIRNHGRFLQRVTSGSTAATTDSDNSLICVIYNEGSKNKDGKRPYLKTYYKTVDERQVLNKIKQTLRFLLDREFGRTERSCVGAATAGDDSLGGPLFTSAALCQTGQDIRLALSNVARLVSPRQALPLPPPHLVQYARNDATALDRITSVQGMLILQERQKQRRQENERALRVLQLLRTGGDAGIALYQHAGSTASSRGGFSGYCGITLGYMLDTAPQVLPTFIAKCLHGSTVPSPSTPQSATHEETVRSLICSLMKNK